MEIESLLLNHGGNLYANEVDQIHKFIEAEPKVIFDIGANVGGFSIRLAEKYPNALIFSFEPILHTFNLLKNNTKDYSNILLYNFGLSNKEDFNIPIGMPDIPSHKKHNYGRATIYNFEGAPIDYIDLVKVSCFCKIKKAYPDYIKIDVEGCEFDILSDLYENELLDKVDIVYIEINNSPHTHDSAQASKDLLLKTHYIVGDSGYNKGNKEPLNYIFKKK